MKKIINASIAGIAFTFEEDAYAALFAYLTEMKDHFDSDLSGDEIVRDIEARIAELLLERGRDVLDLEAVNEVMTVMGNAHALEDTEDVTHATSARTLYRDPDDRILGGVAAGIAAYFGIDPLIVRLIFIVSVFFGGAGIVLYAILWLAVPKAETQAQKLAMRGTPVTVRSLRRAAETGARRVSKESGRFSKFILFPFEILGHALRAMAPFARAVLGAAFVIGGFLAILGATAALTVTVTNYGAEYFAFPLFDAVSESTLAILAGSAYVAWCVPFLFLVLFGVRLLRPAFKFPATLGFCLIGVWSLAVIAAFATGTQLAGQYYTYVSESEQYAHTTVTRELEDFTHIEGMLGSATVTVTEGEPMITIEGRNRDLEMIKTEIEDGTLIVSRASSETSCFIFCDHIGYVELTVSAPQIESVALMGGTLTLDELAAESFSVEKIGGSVIGDVQVGTLLFDAENAHIELRGSAEHAEITLARYSEFASPQFVMQNATATAEYPARAVLNATENLYLNLDSDYTDGLSLIEILGDPAISRARDFDTSPAQAY